MTERPGVQPFRLLATSPRLSSMVLSARREREADRMSYLGEPGPVRIERGDRVVITGASGFIGSAVARAVRARGAHVVAVVEPGADSRNLDQIDAERVTADIRDAAAVRDACKGARFVFHLAAIYRFWARDPRVFYDVNVGGTLNVLDAARAAACERLVFTSSVAVLGLG